MKLKSTVLALMLAILTMIYSSAYADEYQEKKLYVSSDVIQLMQDQIIITTEAGPVITTALFADADGLFVYAICKL